MMSSATSKVAFKAMSCPRRMSCMAAPKVAAIHKKADKQANSDAWSAMPMVCISAVMLLNSGVANATALGKGYGGAVGGSDQFNETVERGIGKVQQGMQDSPINLPDPNSVQNIVPASDTLKGAVEQTVSNVTNAFSTGSDNIKEATGGIGSKVQRGASNVTQNTPDVIKSSAENQAQNGEDTKNFFQSGVDKLQELIGSSGAEDTFKTGIDKTQQLSPKGIQSNLQSGGDAVSGGVEKVKQTASGAQNAFKTGPSDLKGTLQSGKQQVTENVDILKQTSGNVQDAFKTGGDQLSKAAGKAQDLADNVQQGVEDASKKAQQAESTFGQ